MTILRHKDGKGKKILSMVFVIATTKEGKFMYLGNFLELPSPVPLTSITLKLWSLSNLMSALVVKTLMCFLLRIMSSGNRSESPKRCPTLYLKLGEVAYG